MTRGPDRDSPLRIELVTPTQRSRKGNWVTADRWAKIFRRLGHRVSIRQVFSGGDCDLLIALHASKSFASIERYHHQRPDLPLVVALTGTDLYRDIHQHEQTHWALAWADLLILLQPEGEAELPPELREKIRVIRQSATATTASVETTKRWFGVCVLGHLRPVKDPFRTAAAARLLPKSSKIRVLHAGAALSDEMEHRARAEMASNPRYRWLGDRPRWQVRRLLARSHLMVLSSEMEGGANVISEALVAGCPVLSTRIAGSIGLLGTRYPGYFAVGDTEGLAGLLMRCESDTGTLAELTRRGAELAPLFHPDREIEAWTRVLDELAQVRKPAQTSRRSGL